MKLHKIAGESYRADLLTKYTDLAKLRDLSQGAGLHILLTDTSLDLARVEEECWTL